MIIPRKKILIEKYNIVSAYEELLICHLEQCKYRKKIKYYYAKLSIPTDYLDVVYIQDDYNFNSTRYVLASAFLSSLCHKYNVDLQICNKKEKQQLEKITKNVLNKYFNQEIEYVFVTYTKEDEL